MRNVWPLLRTLVAWLLAGAATAAPDPTPGTGAAKMPRQLDRIHLMVHALNWLELTPEDPRRKTETWEQWPGRCALS